LIFGLKARSHIVLNWSMHEFTVWPRIDNVIAIKPPVPEPTMRSKKAAAGMWSPSACSMPRRISSCTIPRIPPPSRQRMRGFAPIGRGVYLGSGFLVLLWREMPPLLLGKVSAAVVSVNDSSVMPKGTSRPKAKLTYLVFESARVRLVAPPSRPSYEALPVLLPLLLPRSRAPFIGLCPIAMFAVVSQD
jgi:hypothetical protein